MCANHVPLPLDGGCQCGGIRYSVTEAPLTLYCCHCTECQAQSSSAFGMSMLVRRASLRVDWAALSTWSRTADSGNRLNCHFCPACGSRLFHVGEADDDIISVKAGSLDDRRILRPVGHIWTDSAQPWFTLPEGSLATARDPGDMTAFMERWREATRE